MHVCERLIVLLIEQLLHQLTGMFRALLSCNHARTVVHEGKCYCPDCGRGLIYQWVILRCQSCQARRESRYCLRQVVPVQRCCAQCGDAFWKRELLESPAYFQLYQARLMVRESFEDETSGPWWGFLSGSLWGQCFERGVVWTLAWLEPVNPDCTPLSALAMLPARSSAR